MKIQGLGKKILLPACAAGLVALACASAFADVSVTKVAPEQTSQQQQQQPSPVPPDSPGLMREHLWEGSFDRAGDATRSVEQQLRGGIEFNCEKYRTGVAATDGQAAIKADPAAYQACVIRQQQVQYYGQEATGIREQQRTFSDISKISDAAAVGAVGAAIYGELGLKNNNQASSFQQAANIQKVAGQASYATGATDLVLGATAYISQKHRLEEMQRTLKDNITVGQDQYAPDVSQANSAITNAIEQTKQAAYNHMLYGAGKVAAGYASMYAAKRSARQAENLRSMEMDQFYQPIAPAATAPTPTVVPLSQGSATPPTYVNNTPVFIYPNDGSLGATTNSAMTTAIVPASSTGGSGSSAAPTGANMRALSSTNQAGKGGLTGSGSAAPAASASGASSAAAGDDAGKEKETKEAVGNSFEMSLTGGVRAITGHSSDAGSGDSTGLGGLLGNLAGADGNKGGTTNISPAQVYQEATEGMENAEGSNAGVSAGNDATLFDLVRKRLNHAQEMGNVGIAKNVEVKN